uniref:Uncharacterized protein n=1 Tax=Burkholderia phage vB_BgluM-SURPRISE13 TaxID=3159457 RepID=A0AAU7PFS7_9VIRU
MLDSSLDNFLENALPAEKYRLYVDIIQYLESIEYDTIEGELLNLIYMSIGDENEKVPKPESTCVDEIYGHLRECMISQLSQSGVTANEEVRLKDVYDLAIGLFHISTHEDIAGIVACCSLDEAPIHQLAEVLQLVTTVSADHWLTIIDEIAPEVIKRIVELSKQTIDSEYQEMEQTAEYLQKIRLFSEYASQKGMVDLRVFSLVAEVILGQNYTTYLDSGVLSELFEGDLMDRLAMEMYGMALMSNDASKDPVGSIRRVIEQYIEDTRRIVALNSQVQLVNAEFVKFYQINSQGLANG